MHVYIQSQYLLPGGYWKEKWLNQINLNIKGSIVYKRISLRWVKNLNNVCRRYQKSKKKNIAKQNSCLKPIYQGGVENDVEKVKIWKVLTITIKTMLMQ